MSRGLVGALERSWSGAPGTVPWTWSLYPVALAYAAGSAVARARAARSRRAVPGLRVIAIGGLTAGGAGKSSVAAWLATELHARGAAPSVLIRGHGATAAERPYVVPDLTGYPVALANARGGDEAAAHRGALSAAIPVAAFRDRYASARIVRAGYGADLAILDDGWEQPWLRWDELWVVLDPDRPAGNGAPIPAGPLRRPVSSLREASVVALIHDEAGSPGAAPAAPTEWIRDSAESAEIVRFRRVLASISALGSSRVRERGAAGAGIDGRALPPAGLLSGIGAPGRLEGFARGVGVRSVSHAAFPDHAAWTSRQIEAAVAEAARKGARVILTTEKDEARWPEGTRPVLPVFVLRTSLTAIDPVESILARARGAVAPAPAIG